jgi:peptide/nickel transport system substrate-binding protein
MSKMRLFRTGAVARVLAGAVALAAMAAPIQARAENVLRWGAGRDIVSLDPYSYGDTFTISVLAHTYEGLVRYNQKLQIEPSLATSWEVLSPTLWRFHLRQGVKFHNGDPMTAEDVLASFTRVSDPASPLRGNLPAYQGATVLDPYTIDVKVTENYPLLLNDLTNIAIFDKKWLIENNAEKPTDFGKGVQGYATDHANGTGPFKIIERKPDAETVFVKNPDWWDAPHHNIDKIVFTPITSPATRVAAMLSGEIDFTNVAPLQDLPRLQANPDLKVMANNELRTVFFLFNWDAALVDSDVKGKNPFLDKRVREALYRAIDIDAIHKRVMRDLSRNTGSIISPAIPGYEPSLDPRPSFDAEAAKKLLAEAGYPTGFRFAFVCENDGYINEEQICQAVAAMWAKIGLTPVIDIAPNSIQTSKFEGRKFDVGILGWANEPMLDSYSILVQVVHTKSGTAGVFNWGGWQPEGVDALIDAAGRELDRPKRLAFQTKALQVLHDDYVFLPLHQQPMAWAAGKHVASMLQLSDNKARHWLTMMQ